MFTKACSAIEARLEHKVRRSCKTSHQSRLVTCDAASTRALNSASRYRSALIGITPYILVTVYAQTVCRVKHTRFVLVPVPLLVLLLLRALVLVLVLLPPRAPVV